MFQDPSRQLKMLAKLLCALGSIGSLLSGIALLFQGAGGMVIGVFILTFGLSTSWIFSLILYGIGKTLQQTEWIAEDTKRIEAYAHSSILNAFRSQLDASSNASE